ncbi:MAG: UDP-glucose--hexose-1-phosphate uridylyltransferase [Clostridia bacterium]|nr:UDP-glucose--hexose-1-phosphate uridylyltransferase [Clostridia bacterium]
MAYINKHIENLLYYAKDKLNLSFEDAIYAKNQLLELFNVENTFEIADRVDLQTEILNPMVAYAVEKGLTAPESALRFETKIMGLVTPAPSIVIEEFSDLFSVSAADATDYLYKLSVSNNYIRMSDIKKNIRWMTSGENGEVGITINLAKPEKDPKQVLAEKNQTTDKYPKCMLCLENLGFAGTLTHPARQTLRYAPITLNGEAWHLQYSPFVYYDEHCIALSDRHIPMKIDENSFARLLDFVGAFPHYFMGSNADLPIVGGSILSHDHYQGGRKVLPMFYRPLKKQLSSVLDASIAIRDWYNSVVHVSSRNKFRALELANQIYTRWQSYTDESVGILAYTNAPHNTVTPIASMNSKGEYCLDLILRNNRTDEKNPFGIYHPTEDMHNIKKEGIGLIEAMGLFILPGRLKAEINDIINLLASGNIDFRAINEDERLSKHFGLIAQIANNLGAQCDKKSARDAVIDYINQTCIKILECTAVFKNNKQGELAFDRFLKFARE